MIFSLLTVYSVENIFVHLFVFFEDVPIFFFHGIRCVFLLSVRPSFLNVVYGFLLIIGIVYFSSIFDVPLFVFFVRFLCLSFKCVCPIF